MIDETFLWRTNRLRRRRSSSCVETVATVSRQRSGTLEQFARNQDGQLPFSYVTNAGHSPSVDCRRAGRPRQPSQAGVVDSDPRLEESALSLGPSRGLVVTSTVTQRRPSGICLVSPSSSTLSTPSTSFPSNRADPDGVTRASPWAWRGTFSFSLMMRTPA